MKSKKGSSKIKYVAFAPSQKSDNKLVYQFASSQPEPSPAMPSHNCISKRGGQFTAAQLLSIDSKVRKLEKKHFKQAVMLLALHAIPLPSAQNLQKYNRDLQEKRNLQEVSGVRQTVNPLMLRKPFS